MFRSHCHLAFKPQRGDTWVKGNKTSVALEDYSMVMSFWCLVGVQVEVCYVTNSSSFAWHEAPAV